MLGDGLMLLAMIVLEKYVIVYHLPTLSEAQLSASCQWWRTDTPYKVKIDRQEPEVFAAFCLAPKLSLQLWRPYLGCL